MGTLTAMQRQRGNLILKINAEKVLDALALGDSVAVNGPCLTVTEVGSDWFSVEASSLTIRSSTTGTWQIGRKVNLERALRVGDRLGGHIVQGHIDGTGLVTRIKSDAGSSQMFIDIPKHLQKLMVSRGSIAIDGVSLTIAEKIPSGVSLMIIPHTLGRTTLSDLKPGAVVNIESDLIIRWLAERFPENPEGILPDTVLANLGNIHLED